MGKERKLRRGGVKETTTNDNSNITKYIRMPYRIHNYISNIAAATPKSHQIGSSSDRNNTKKGKYLGCLHRDVIIVC